MTGQTPGLHSLSTIIKRLEAVTSRLEDVATSQASPAPAVAPAGTGAGSTAAATAGTGTGAGAGAGAVAAAPAAPATTLIAGHAAPATAGAVAAPATAAYEDLISGPLAELLAVAKQIGGAVEEETHYLAALSAAQLAFLQLASAHAKPASPAALAPLLKPQAEVIAAAQEAKDKLSRGKEGREYGAFLSAVAEGVSAWGWVQVEPAPAPFVGEMKNAAQFWSDRVIKQFKETKPEAVAWSRALISLLDALQKYVKQWHTTGVVWDPRGPPAPASVPAAGAAAPAAASGPPPPPPPPPTAPAPAPAPAASSGPTGQMALLADLNRGGSVTSGLRKVDPSQQTHKNPELRAGSIVPDKKEPPAIKAKPGSLSQAAPKKPARTELEGGNKWIIENHENNREISIDNTELHQTVHIFSCTNSVIRIGGKVNAINLVGSKKVSLVVDSAVSSLSITSSPSFEVQITGTVPTVQIDSTDSGQVYLSEATKDITEIITSKTSSINISVPAGPDGDFVERPVPEQIKSRIVNGKLVTEIVEHAG